MIKLSNIEHRHACGKVTYALPGGRHVSSAMQAIAELDDINSGRPVYALPESGRTRCVVIRRKAKDARVSIL